MRTTEIKIGGEKREALLVAGGPGFKIYSTSGLDGWVLVIARKSFVIPEADAQFKIVARYVNLKYQPVNQQADIKDQFMNMISSLSEKSGPGPEADL
jgi:hypothetical protein